MLQPRFFPGPSSSQGCLEILEHLLHDEQTSKAGPRAPSAGPVRAGAHTPGNRGLAFGFPGLFNVLRNGGALFLAPALPLSSSHPRPPLPARRI